ncbi:MAG TPA: peptidylprolyl isomerase [Salinimicrobium sp.]|nr:peptidylprolyl isomerase [Salinimicrobium sp.]
MIKKILFGAFFFIFTTSIGQHLENKVLFSVEGEPVYAEEFLNVYNKNQDLVEVKSERNIDEYLQMFIDYKLKIKAAEALGLDANPEFQREFLGYRNQLAKKFMTDSHVTDALVHEAYERTIEEVNAAHILLLLEEDATPSDTLEVYNRAIELRKKIINGGDFAALAKQFSEDPSVRKNAGELGWFSAFKMVYPFEDAAYKTEVGTISMPVRTNFGYHLIKVNDKRKSRGEVVVAHIMVADKENVNAEKKINQIYSELKESDDFENLAIKYSDDKATAEKGGRLKRFGAGELNSPEFEDLAFNLKTPGEISEPFKTQYGWHIVKLIEKYPIASFAETQRFLEDKVRKDSRSRVITEAFVQKLKNDYKIGGNSKSLEYFEDLIEEKNSDLNLSADEEQDLKEKVLVKVRDTSLTYFDFYKFYKLKNLKSDKDSNVNVLMKQWHDDYINNFILEYHQNHLEAENSEFASIAKEYKEGLLLFELMEDKIWNAAKQDSIGLEKFYQDHKSQYEKDADFEEIKGLVINDYQSFLEKKWLNELRETYKVKMNKKVFSNLKKSLGKD